MPRSDASKKKEGGSRNGLRKLARAYRSTAIVGLNFLVFLILLNFALGAGYAVRDALTAPRETGDETGRLFTDDGAPVDNGRRTQKSLEWYDFGALQGVSPEYADRMLTDFYELWQKGFVYQPWVQFSEPPFDGELVHVDIDGKGFPVRRTANEGLNAETPEDVRHVYTVGGSTTFGDHVSDEHTWPSHLSDVLNERASRQGLPFAVKVTNYGRGYYHPSQEVALLWDLLRTGHRPSLVIFMDGVNVPGPSDEPHFKPEIAQAFLTAQHGSPIRRADVVAQFDWVPMIRLARDVDAWLFENSGAAGGDGDGLSGEYWDDRIHRGVQQFRHSRRLARQLCQMYGCRVLFFLQPNVFYRYNLDLYRLELPSTFTRRIGPFRRFYEIMREDSVYIDLSGLFEEWGPDRKAIVDDLHYTPAFNRFLAEHVAARVGLATLPELGASIVDSAASANPRSVVSVDGWLRPPAYGGFAGSDGRR